MNAASDRMKELRTEADLKQYELADKLGMKQSMLSYYENGREASHDVLFAYMKFFDVSADYLLGVTDEKKPLSNDLVQYIATTGKIAGSKGAYNVVTGESIHKLFKAMRVYYEAGAPSGSLPMETLSGFIEGFTAVLNACAEGDTVALLNSVNATGMTVLDVTKIITKYMENNAVKGQ